MNELDRAAVSYQVVMTKIDKPSTKDLESAVARTRAAIAKRPAAHPDIIQTSSEKGTGPRSAPHRGRDAAGKLSAYRRSAALSMKRAMYSRMVALSEARSNEPMAWAITSSPALPRRKSTSAVP